MTRLRKTADPRHAEVKALLEKYWAGEAPGVALPWGPADAGALGTFLRSNPQMTVEQITKLLRNRYASEDHARGEPVFMWIKYLPRYLGGPLNKFKQPKVASNAEPTRADNRNRQAVDATSAAVRRLQGLAGDSTG